MGTSAYGLAFLAGVLSTLSPCVLPLLPIVLGSAFAAHRLAPLALAGGLLVSFVAIGLFAATIGFSIGIDDDAFRYLAAAVLAVFGASLLLGNFLAGPTARASAWSNGVLARLNPEGPRGQFLLGLTLGAAWSPCAGPTLGTAATLAAQRRSLASVAMVMVMFGIGAALPLVLAGGLSREAMLRWRGRLLGFGSVGRRVLGGVMVLLAVAIVTGRDHQYEALLVAHSPDWLTNLTTHY